MDLPLPMVTAKLRHLQRPGSLAPDLPSMSYMVDCPFFPDGLTAVQGRGGPPCKREAGAGGAEAESTEAKGHICGPERSPG